MQRELGRRGALGALGAVGLARVARAQAGWAPDHPVEIVVGTPPGSGTDLPARVLQKIWTETHMVGQPVTVSNKPGGFNAVANAYIARHPGQGNYLTTTGTLLLSDYLAGNTTMSFRDFTPITVFMSEEIGFGVNAEGPIRSGGDFIDRLRHDPASVSVALSGVGGQNHITLGLVAHAAGVDATKLKVVGFQGAPEGLIALMGNHVDATVGPVSLLAPQMAAGKLRIIAIASDKRMEGPLAGIPTWREQGVDAVFSQWRGMVGPKDMTPAQIAFWDSVLARSVQSADWLDYIRRAQLVFRYLDSHAMGGFLEAENSKVKAALTDIGLLKVAGR